MDKYKNDTWITWGIINEIIGKSKLRIKKLPHRIVIDEKNNWCENNCGKVQSLFVNIGPKLASKNTSVKFLKIC